MLYQKNTLRASALSFCLNLALSSSFAETPRSLGEIKTETQIRELYDGQRTQDAPTVVVQPAVQKSPPLTSDLAPRFGTLLVVPLPFPIPAISDNAEISVHSYGDALLDAVNPFALFLNKLLGVSHASLAPERLFTEPGKGPIVGINGVSSNEIYQDAADYMTGRGIASARHTYQARAGSPTKMIEILLQAYHQEGPIRRLVIAAHGSQGSFMIGELLIDASWEQPFYLPQDLFAPGAEVILISCSVGYRSFWAGNGSTDRSGIDSIKAIFTPLLRQGGTVIASTRYVDPELDKIPEEYTNGPDRLKRHIMSPLIAAIETTEWLFADNKSRFHKIVRVEIPPSFPR